jgi:hypothetical protein
MSADAVYVCLYIKWSTPRFCNGKEMDEATTKEIASNIRNVSKERLLAAMATDLHVYFAGDLDCPEMYYVLKIIGFGRPSIIDKENLALKHLEVFL